MNEKPGKRAVLNSPQPTGRNTSYNYNNKFGVSHDQRSGLKEVKK
jgi:hypothetical protein